MYLYFGYVTSNKYVAIYAKHLSEIYTINNLLNCSTVNILYLKLSAPKNDVILIHCKYKIFHIIIYIYLIILLKIFDFYSNNFKNYIKIIYN